MDGFGPGAMMIEVSGGAICGFARVRRESAPVTNEGMKTGREDQKIPFCKLFVIKMIKNTRR